MWLMTIHGFFSISIRDGNAVIRARTREHLLALKARFGFKQSVQTNGTRDYRYRVTMPKAQWVILATALAQEQTWNNFKSEAQATRPRDKQYIEKLHDVWHTMSGLQDVPPYGGLLSRDTFPAHQHDEPEPAWLRDMFPEDREATSHTYGGSCWRCHGTQEIKGPRHTKLACPQCRPGVRSKLSKKKRNALYQTI